MTFVFTTLLRPPRPYRRVETRMFPVACRIPGPWSNIPVLGVLHKPHGRPLDLSRQHLDEILTMGADTAPVADEPDGAEHVALDQEAGRGARSRGRGRPGAGPRHAGLANAPPACSFGSHLRNPMRAILSYGGCRSGRRRDSSIGECAEFERSTCVSRVMMDPATSSKSGHGTARRWRNLVGRFSTVK